MAQYFTADFADWGTDWTERYNTSPDWPAALSGGDVSIPSTSANDWTAHTWNDVEDGNHAEVDVLFTLYSSSFSGLTRPFLLRGSGADESATHVHFSIGASSHTIGYCAGSDTRTNIATHSTTYSTATWYWVRVRISGTGTPSYKTKVWTGTAADEPGGAGSDSNWDLNSTDTNIPDAAGWVGFCWNSNTAAAITIGQLGVGTNGDVAPSSSGAATTRGMPFGIRGTAFNGGRVFVGPITN